MSKKHLYHTENHNGEHIRVYATPEQAAAFDAAVSTWSSGLNDDYDVPSYNIGEWLLWEHIPEEWMDGHGAPKGFDPELVRAFLRTLEATDD